MVKISRMAVHKHHVKHCRKSFLSSAWLHESAQYRITHGRVTSLSWSWLSYSMSPCRQEVVQQQEGGQSKPLLSKPGYFYVALQLWILPIDAATSKKRTLETSKGILPPSLGDIICDKIGWAACVWESSSASFPQKPTAPPIVGNHLWQTERYRWSRNTLFAFTLSSHQFQGQGLDETGDGYGYLVEVTLDEALREDTNQAQHQSKPNIGRLRFGVQREYLDKELL